MRDGPLRRAIKALARAAQVVDLRLARRLRGAPLFRLEGACTACSACCEAPAVQVPRLLFHLRSWRAVLVFWHRHVNGFVLEHLDRRSHVLVFRCTHLDPTTRRCDSYASRPLMCRDYPRPVLDHTPPELFPTCGFLALPTNAEGLDRALQAQGLAPEHLEELRRRLGIG